MIKLTLPDNSVREIEAAQPASEIVKGIGMGLFKSACCVKVNGEVDTRRGRKLYPGDSFTYKGETCLIQSKDQ